MAQSSSLWSRLITAAKTPSPEWMRPAEKVIRDVSTYEIPGVKETSPLYWLGKYNQAVAPSLPTPLKEAVQVTGDVAVGGTTALAKMATPMNIGLALTAPETVLGKAAISSIFTAQAVANTPAMVEQIKKDYAAGDVHALTEHTAGLAASYLPAAHFLPGGKGGAKAGEAKAEEAPPKPTPEQNRDLMLEFDRLVAGEITQEEYAARAKGIVAAAPTVKAGKTTYTYDEATNRYRDENGNPIEDETEIEKISKAEEKQKEPVVETEQQTEDRARDMMVRYRNLAGEPEAVLQDMIDAGQAPTWGEFADELQGEINKLTATPELALQARNEATAKRRGMTPQQLDEEFGNIEVQMRLRTINEGRNAELSRRELDEEKKQPKGGKYAKQPSPTQVQGGYSALGIETRPAGAEPTASNRYNVERETQGAGARGNVPGAEPEPAATPLVEKSPGAAEAGLEQELRNRARHRIEEQLGLPKDPAELLKQQEDGTAPSDSEINRLVDIVYNKLVKERAAAKAAEPGPGAAPPKHEVTYKIDEHGNKVPVKVGAHRSHVPFPMEHPERSPEIEAENAARMREIAHEEANPPQDTIAGQVEAEYRRKKAAEKAAEEARARGEVPVQPGEFKEKGYTAVPTEAAPAEAAPVKPKSFKVRTAIDDFAAGPETPVATAVADMGGIKSKTAAQEQGKLKGNEALWDDKPQLRHPSHNKIYKPGGEMPDVMAQSLHDAGLIGEPTTNAMYRALEKESDHVRTREKQKPGGETENRVKQARNFGEGQRDEMDTGTKPIYANGLSVGDSVEVDGTKLKVTDVDPDGNVTLEDGRRFGIQEVANDDIIYGEVKEGGPGEEPPAGAVAATKPKTPAGAPGEAQKFSTKTNFKKVGDSRYEHKQTKLIINKGKEGGWDARHPTTGETIGNYPSRQAAMEAHADGGVVPIAKEGKALRLKANKEGGYVNAEIFQEAVDFGKRLLSKGLDYGRWAKEMVKHLGQKVAGRLKEIWENLTGGKMRPGFKESGEIGRTGGPAKGFGQAKEPAKEPEFRKGYGRPENQAQVSRQANARLQINPRHADRLVSDLLSGKKTSIDTADQQVLIQHRAMLQGARDTAASRMKNKQVSPGDQAEASATFEDLDAQIRALDNAVRDGLMIKAPAQRSLWHTFRAKDYSFASMRDKLFSAKNGKPLTKQEEALLDKHASKLSDMMAKIEGLKRTSGWKPGDPNPPPGMRGMQSDAFKAKVALDHMIFKAKLQNKPLPTRMWLTGREFLAIPRAIMASLDLSAVRRQGGLLFLSHPIRSLRIFPDMLRAARSEDAYFSLMQDLRERPNAELYKSSKLGMTDIQSPKLETMEEQYMSRWAEHIPLVAHSQRAYVYYLNRLRADSFDAMAKTLSRKGAVTETQAKVISDMINVFTGRGAVNSHKAMATMVALNDAFFAPRYILSRFQAITGQPLRFALKNKEARALIASEYARVLIGYGLVYGLVGTALPGIAKVEWDPRSTDFGKIRIGNTRIDIMSGLSQATVLLSRLATRQTKQQSGKIESLTAGGKARASRLVGGVVQDFVRSKLAPVPAFLWNVEEGKKVTGEPTQLLPKGQPFTKTFDEGELLRMVTPLSGSDVVNAMVEYGVPKGAALGMLAFFGDSVNTYSPRTAKVRTSRHHR